MKRQIIISVIVGVIALSTGVRAAEGELTFVRRDLLPENNAYTLWTNALPQLKLPDDNGLYEAFKQAGNLATNMRVGEALTQLDAWLASKNEPLSLLSQGIRLGQLQLPVYDVENLSTFPFSGLHHAAKMKVVLAREDVENGQYELAADQFIDVFRMGQLVAAGDGPLIPYLFAVGVQSMGLNGMRWLATNPDTPRAVLVQMIRELPIPDESDPVLAQVYRVEFTQFSMPGVRRLEREALSPTKSFPIPIACVLDVTNTISTFESFYIRLVKNALGPWSDRDTDIESDTKSLVTLRGIKDPADFGMALMMRSSLKQDRKSAKKWKQLEKFSRKQPNILGKILVTMMMPACESVHQKSVKTRTEINLTRAFVAVQCFRRDFGSWPESLSDARFKSLLPDDPIDLFAGKPIQYSQEKSMLWSVGPDEKDDGGDMKKDFVIKLPNHASEVTACKLAEPQR